MTLEAAVQEASPNRGEASGRRFSAEGMSSSRRKLGLSASDFALWVGTPTQSRDAWEVGKSAPKRALLSAGASLRDAGQRGAAGRLTQLKAWRSNARAEATRLVDPWARATQPGSYCPRREAASQRAALEMSVGVYIVGAPLQVHAHVKTLPAGLLNGPTWSVPILSKPVEGRGRIPTQAMSRQPAHQRASRNEQQ